MITDEELASYERQVASWMFSRRTIGEKMIAEIHRLKSIIADRDSQPNDELEYELKIIEGSIPLLEESFTGLLKSYRTRIAFLINEIRKLKRDKKCGSGSNGS